MREAASGWYRSCVCVHSLPMYVCPVQYSTQYTCNLPLSQLNSSIAFNPPAVTGFATHTTHTVTHTQPLTQPLTRSLAHSLTRKETQLLEARSLAAEGEGGRQAGVPSHGTVLYRS